MMLNEHKATFLVGLFSVSSNSILILQEQNRQGAIDNDLQAHPVLSRRKLSNDFVFYIQIIPLEMAIKAVR